MDHYPLESLSVIGIRYRRTTPDMADERGLDAYAASPVYAAANVPVTIEEPTIAPDECSGDAVEDLGRFNGKIADAVSAARRSGAVILMTGGDCSHATGIVGGLQDAHGDFNTPTTSQSGSLGGMPVAVCAGLAYPGWREGAHIASPLPTDRILLVGARNLDEAEATLIQTTNVAIAAPSSGFPGKRLEASIDRLSERCDAIYLHIDADFLDQTLVPNHGNGEPNGPAMAQAMAAVETVMSTGKVIALALVSIYNCGPEASVGMKSGIEWLQRGLESWHCYGTTQLPIEFC